MKLTLGEELKKLIPEGTAQKAMAMSWLETWSRRHPKEPKSSDTAETRLSQCLSNQLPGVRFYFGDQKRREVTLEVFGVPQASRQRLERLAEDLLATEPAPRVVLDATSGPQSGDPLDEMFRGIKARFLGEDAVWPMLLLVTDQQYERLPRTYDDLKQKLVVKRLPAGDAARAELRELVDQGALAVAPYPCVPYERWLAVQLTSEMPCLPPDALGVFAREGALPSLPEVTMPLARIAEEPKAPVNLPSKDPFALRKLMHALASGEAERLGRDTYYFDEYRRADQARRLSWARQLGVVAAASREEWLDALPKRIAPVPFVTSGRWLEHARWLARRGGASTVFSFAGKVVAINPPEPVKAELATLGHFEVEEVPHAGFPALERMLGEAAAMTADDLLDDPFLDALLARHASATDPADRFGLEAAYHALCSSSNFRPAPTKATQDWRGALAALLEDTEPEARLRLSVQRSRDPGGESEEHLVPARPTGSVSWRAPLTDVTIHRGQALTAVGPAPRENGYHFPRDVEQFVTPGLGDSPAGWFEQVLAGLTPTKEDLAARRQDVPQLQRSAFTVPQDRWQSADRELAFLLGALRVAAATAAPLPLPEGRVMLPLGGGIFAEVHARAHAASRGRRPVGSLVQPVTCEKGAWKLLSLTTRLVTHHAVSSWRGMESAIGVDVPHGAHLAGRGYRADVILRASPLFAGMGSAETHAAVASTSAASAAAAVAAEEAQAAEDDDD